MIYAPLTFACLGELQATKTRIITQKYNVLGKKLILKTGHQVEDKDVIILTKHRYDNFTFINQTPLMAPNTF